MKKTTQHNTVRHKTKQILKRILSSALILICLLSMGSIAFATSSDFIVPPMSYSENDNFYYTVSDEGVTIIGCKGSKDGKIIIPSEIDGSPVTTIDNNAFAMCNIREVTIPDTVTTIGFAAFSNTCLKSITIPASVTSIGPSVFYGSGLTSITVDENNPVYHSDGNCVIETKTKTLVAGCSVSVIPSDGSVTTIGKEAFNQCMFTEISIPDCIESIEEYAFIFCMALKNITIPDSVKTIGDRAFRGCSELTGIVIPDSVESIGEGAFDDCYDLSDVRIGSGVKSIARWAFSGCGIERITVSKDNKAYHSENNCLIETKSKTLIRGCKNSKIPADGSVTAIGPYAFEYCDFKTITIPDCVTEIMEYAFYFSKLESVIIGNGVKSIPDAAFFRNHNLSSVTIGNSVESIGRDAFTGCASLKKITLPDSVKIIEQEAFYQCYNLKAIIMGTGIESIGGYAFSCCSKLSDIYYGGSVEDWNSININKGNDYLENARIHCEGEKNILLKVMAFIRSDLSYINSFVFFRLADILMDIIY